MWLICSWHKNQRLFQIGTKSDETGYEIYDLCRSRGAIITTGHEHSYSRTKTMRSYSQQTYLNGPITLSRSQGTNVAWVSGVSGQQVRPSSRNLKNNPWWASAIAADSHPTLIPGCLFCNFNVNGNMSLAYCYFKQTDNVVRDEFWIYNDFQLPTSPPPTTPEPTTEFPTTSLPTTTNTGSTETPSTNSEWTTALTPTQSSMIDWSQHFTVIVVGVATGTAGTLLVLLGVFLCYIQKRSSKQSNLERQPLLQDALISMGDDFAANRFPDSPHHDTLSATPTEETRLSHTTSTIKESTRFDRDWNTKALKAKKIFLQCKFFTIIKANK